LDEFGGTGKLTERGTITSGLLAMRSYSSNWEAIDIRVVGRRRARLRLTAKTTLKCEVPVDTTRRNDARNLPLERPLERWSPRDKLEPEPVVDHREAARSESDAPSVHAGDVFTFRRGFVGLRSIGLRPFEGFHWLAMR
jgi:hypothetical protein